MKITTSHFIASPPDVLHGARSCAALICILISILPASGGPQSRRLVVASPGVAGREVGLCQCSHAAKVVGGTFFFTFFREVHEFANE